MRQLFLLITLLITIGLGSAFPVQGAQSLSEAELKAAYLYNFAKFIYWPEGTFINEQSPLVIGVLGKNPFPKELLPLSAKKVRNRPITIRQFAKIKDIQLCHLLYISPSISTNLQSVLDILHTKPIVTVGDQKTFVHSGGIIQFVTRRDRLRFLINLKTAEENKIKINSQLLTLAVDILDGEQ